MARKFQSSLLLPVVLSAVAGMLGGVIGGWFLASPLERRLSALETSNAPRPAATSTAPTFQVVPIEARPTVSALPASFLTRRSPVLGIAKKTDTLKTVDERLYGRDRTLAEAVALTSDGWIASTYAAVASFRMSDLVVLWEGKAYPITQAIRDTATGAVFIKIEAHDLPATAFVRADDVVAGSAVWVEPSAKRLYPDTVVDVRARSSTDAISSERASRRFVLGMNTDAAWRGSAVWDTSGRLVGLLESHGADGWNVLPASDLSSALGSLLSTKEIRHAFLGVHAIDLGSVALLATSSTVRLPEQGAWLKTDHRTGAPAVTLGGPAGTFLKEGDVIERMERDTLDGAADIGERLLDYRPGTTIVFFGQRQNQPFEASIRLGSVVTGESLK